MNRPRVEPPVRDEGGNRFAFRCTGAPALDRKSNLALEQGRAALEGLTPAQRAHVLLTLLLFETRTP